MNAKCLSFVYDRQLADVTRDGALSLEEFFTAMHLVVLRRNNIELPETLPASLNPVLQVTVCLRLFILSKFNHMWLY